MAICSSLRLARSEECSKTIHRQAALREKNLFEAILREEILCTARVAFRQAKFCCNNRQSRSMGHHHGELAQAANSG
jgi:hypothetical protein